MKKEKPGKFPFTRGLYSGMYSSRLWTMRQYAGFTSAKESNKRFKYLLKNGVMGLSVAFDLPTQIGFDSDDKMAEGEVGRVGVPISTLDNIESLFQDIPLEKVSTSMTINSTAAILLSFYVVNAEKRGVPLSKLRGTIQNDILKEFAARGTYIYPPKPSMRVVTNILEFCDQNLPKWNPISISGYHIREAGSTVEQELAFTFANAQSNNNSKVDLIYTSTTIEAKLQIDQFLKANPDKKNKINQLYNKDYIYLTNDQYYPIEQYIKSFKKIDSDKNIELNNYKETWFNRYHNVKEILNN